MGRLIDYGDFKAHEKSSGHLDPNWYFEDAYFDRGSGGGWSYQFNVSNTFAFRRAIHISYFGTEDMIKKVTADHRARMIEIRRFVERSCLGVCIRQEHPMHYEYLSSYIQSSGREHWYRRKILHGYMFFHFEEETDAALFALKFPVCEIEERHPTFEVPEEQIAAAKAEPWKGESW